jgi:EAL domain-containing protein (putative c-di-GMP-specific phosphodiesterase class I)
LYYVSASVGSARSPDDTDDAEALLHAADIAMSHAKRRARGSYVHYSREIHAADTVARTHEAELRDAIASGQFRLHYQPIFDAASGRLAAVEALLRWQHPEHGLVAPGAFIPLAEKTGLIEPIGRWVLRAACTQMVAWRHAGVDVPRVTVNVSTAQFTSSRFAQSVQALLETAGLPPDALEIEITENVLIERIDETLGVISDLKVIGVRVSIDDFGTGYSSLSSLRKLPIDVLKIDRSFVMSTPADAEACAIVEVILGLAKRLALDVVAEGVETAEQAAYLLGRGCPLLQGYRYARPIPAPLIVDLIRSEARAMAAAG